MRTKQIHMTLIFGAFLLILFGCDTRNRSMRSSFDINGITEYVELRDTLTLLVLGYAPAQECNDSVRWFSTCFGVDIKTDEIIKVLTECNMDTAISKGMYVNIIPQEQKKEKGSSKIRQGTIWVIKNREYEYSPLYKLQVKTTYGKIIKM